MDKRRIINAIESGFPDKAISLLEKSDRLLSLNDINSISWTAYYSNCSEILSWLELKSSHRFEISNYDDMFWLASSNNLTNIVKYLLSTGRIDSETIFDALENAIRNNNLEIFEILLNHSSIDPSRDNNHLISGASLGGNIDIVNLLLSDKRVDPSDDYNSAICLASTEGHVEIIKTLLNDKRVDPSDEEAIIGACQYGHIESVKILLSDERVNPSIKSNKAIIEALEFDHIEIVRLLLRDKRVNPSQLDEKRYKLWEIIRILERT